MKIYSVRQNIFNMSLLELLEFLCGKELWVAVQRPGCKPEYIKVLDVRYNRTTDYGEVLCNHIWSFRLDGTTKNGTDINSLLARSEDYYVLGYLSLIKPIDMLTTDEIIDAYESNLSNEVD